jgi:hypothetical protein
MIDPGDALRTRLDQLLQDRATIQIQIDEIRDRLDELDANQWRRGKCGHVHVNYTGGATYPSCIRGTWTCPNPACPLYRNPNPVKGMST